jgi:hypothetical protein
MTRPYPGWDWPDGIARTFDQLAAAAGLTFAQAPRAVRTYLIAPPTPAFPQGVTLAHFGWPQSTIRLATILASPGVLDKAGNYDDHAKPAFSE